MLVTILIEMLSTHDLTLTDLKNVITSKALRFQKSIPLKSEFSNLRY